MRKWVRRTIGLQRELEAIADVDPRWWLLSAGVAIAETRATTEVYLACDAEPDADTLRATEHCGARRRRRCDPRNAAWTALRELDGSLRISCCDHHRAELDTEPGRARSTSPHCSRNTAVGGLTDDRFSLPGLLPWLRARPAAMDRAAPFVCVSIGDERIETARHGHRRAWTRRGPWLGPGAPVTSRWCRPVTWSSTATGTP